MTDWGAIIDATWPAAHSQQSGPWVLRLAPGGGNRVNAATANGTVTAKDVTAAAQVMQERGQDPVFRVHDGNAALDDSLQSAGYMVRDATVIYACDISRLTCDPVPPVTAFRVWPPLAAQRGIWKDGGIGPARVAIMDRVQGVKTTILGRADDRAAGTLFVAIHDKTAMLHALEVAAPYRRLGLGMHLTRAAAHWAQAQRATQFSLLVTEANTGANELYASLGLQRVGGYHYRVLSKEPS